MPDTNTHLIKSGAIAESDYALAREASAFAPGQIVPLPAFLADDAADAVIITPDDEVETIAERLKQVNVVALDFPAFNDGRAFSSATMLRRKYGYSGEIRAVGDVRVDQLEQMVRCGFDAFELAAGQIPELAIEKLKGFTHSYQETSDRQPLFATRS